MSGYEDRLRRRSRSIDTVTLTLHRFDSLGARLWAFAQMGLARRALRRVEGIGFHKLLGSGSGEGFTPVPNTAVYGILAVWPDRQTARRAIETAPVFRRFRTRANEQWTVFLDPTSVRGEWDAQQPFRVAANPAGPVVALTRATIKPSVLLKFWQKVPAISAVIGADQNRLFKIGIGEVPWLHQITFSIWPDTQSMAAFARVDGPHAEAIRAVRAGNWFAEELYARFRISGEIGQWSGPWPGPTPLTHLDLPKDQTR
ncbi:spheroidene monooxygenase [Pontivivens insulae]|uniref:Spheroidene monooxygenase n=1 Tax=Pontivivens insulae TaxID=1639689 RepID=A0A2R8A9W5_9RHOB|nr:spheroidene monooxygenase [Pontivivens insulae]RED12901.1 spheroidene monooxygenase [Pontivivens insulae]SPF28993.1 Spheroidene monooxygenase [Pontivivens insulae]